MPVMYRRHAAQHSVRAFNNIASAAQSTVGTLAGFFETLVKLGVFAQAERENRRFNRVAKRQHRNSVYSESGLNGARAMARRARQIAAGSLTTANGLVP